jgi:deoxyribonuclease V
MFEVAPAEAAHVQRELRDLIVESDVLSIDDVSIVAGFDLAYAEKSLAVVCGCVYSTTDMRVVHVRCTETEVRFPYIPGLLAFREGPAILKCYEALVNDGYRPDVLMIDGHGVAHPRRCGVASHIGVAVGMPSIGVAKTVLTGTYTDPATTRGAVVYLRDVNGEVIGAAVRTRTGVKPIFVSVGHLVSLQTAIALSLALARFRIPEPVRVAHLRAEAHKRLRAQVRP